MADFVYADEQGGTSQHVVKDVTSVEFAPGHVVFRNDRFIILAERNDRVHNLQQMADESFPHRVPPAGDRR